ncbi:MULTISPECIES: helix-turn-helix domain-containing protein [Micromonospora]|uniref:helix-turn-helix domain-containing protein n=1 Tax=Micromonospora TaxID=1873 RepID=UPI001EE8B381|nr:helix-turn-helix transcriptional regulator [Micromonospora hortensis]MCG5448243.1 helix-turn-helix domain-containing protein [Micromonospora hortensis]WTI10437.1 helix-turn-helix domain-containing protein [Micromonospora sp. NBC_00821]
MTTGELRPDDASDPAEFVEMLRQLKDRSGLTYRQLEQRAASTGDVLARSTAADILRRSTLPRPEVVAAFVRACGAGDQVETWLRARHRLTAGQLAPLSPAADPPPADAVTTVAPAHSGPARPRWFARPAPLALLVVAAVLATLGVGFWIERRDDEQGKAPASAGDGARFPSAGLSQIRPVRSPHLCLTEGRDRTGRYTKEIAVQRPCSEATPPDTSLEPVADGMFFIHWVHPVLGKGCLTIREEDPGRDLLEPWNEKDCSADRPKQVFHFEPAGATPGAYRIRPDRSELCVGLRDDDSDVSDAALVEPCTGGSDQVFLVNSLPGN